MTEAQYQAKLIKTLKRRFPECVVLKNDPTYIQGIPDLTVLYWEKWAALEVKRSRDAPRQPNQEHYINELGQMSFSAVIYPENEEAVLRSLAHAFTS